MATHEERESGRSAAPPSSKHQGKVRQRLIATLGRRDDLVATGALDDLLRSLAKFSERLRVVDRVRQEGLQAHTARAWGPALVFGRLWDEQGVPEILRRLARGRRFGVDVERACFALARQRLCAPGSDLQGASWLQTIMCPGGEALELPHLSRTVGGFLAPRRADLERELFFRDRDLFTPTPDLVFIDTTSTFIWRPEESARRRRGYARDRRPDQPQVVIGLAVDRHGWPIAWDLLPGNTDDRTAFTETIGTLRTRFQIGRVIVVADREMISQKVRDLLTGDERAPFDYILGCRLRQDRTVADEVLARAGRYHPVDGRTSLQVKEVHVGDLQHCLEDRAVDVSWPDLMRDLSEVRAVDLTLDGQRYRLRTDLGGTAYHAFAAAGVRPPALVTPLGPAPAAPPPLSVSAGVEVPA